MSARAWLRGPLWRLAARRVGQPAAYSRLQRLVGSAALWERLRDEVLRPVPGQTVLDIGCGPADVLAALPPAVAYTGIDTSAEYIRGAQARFGERGRFEVGRSADWVGRADGPYDLVLALGLLHHLDDAVARAVIRDAAALAPGGRLVTLDGCRQPGAPPWERLFYAVDRGRHVRDRSGYLSLAEGVGPVRATLWPGALRVPYTYLVMEVQLP